MTSYGSTRRAAAGVACALLALTTGSARASFIDTTSTWNFSSGVGPFGESTSSAKHAAPTYGQTFTVGPVDNNLNNFSFWVNDSKMHGPVTLDAYVMQWDGTKAVGPVLWQSSPTTTTNNKGKGGMEKLTFNTGGLTLTPGKEYVAFISTSAFFDGGTHTARVGFTYKNTYPHGEFVYINNGSDLSKLTTTSWHTAHHGHDLAFRANFSGPLKTPAPPGLLLGVIGSGSLLGYAWRGRRKRGQGS
jgi:hypothetical protein